MPLLGVGVAIAIAFCPVGVVALGVICPGVILGVRLPGVVGVMLPWALGVILGVIVPGVVAPIGVSSHLDLRLLAPGVGVSWMRSPPRSVRGVSAQPLP